MNAHSNTTPRAEAHTEDGASADRVRFDAIVLGGGPAGSTASSLIAKAGHRVLLLEREQFPRYSIGESLLPATIHGICRLLGVKKKIDEAGFTVKRGGTFRWGKRREPWVFTFGNAQTTSALDFHYAYQVERSRFDQILLEHARSLGVDVRERSEANEILVSDGRISGVQWTDRDGVRHSTRARYVVDATGHRASFHRLAGKRIFSKYFQNIAIFAYFHGGKRVPKPNDGNIVSCAFEDGWFWYIPLSAEVTSVGVVVDKKHSKRIGRHGAEASLNRFIQACPMIRELLADATRITEGELGQVRTRSDYSYCNEAFWRPGLVLVGDSACFVDPVFSSGVHLATYSGMMAARAINSSLRQPSHERIWFDAFEARYRKEYQVFYDFLVGFYEMGVDEGTYFWRARDVLKTKEAANEAFVRLVAGAGTTMNDFLEVREGLGAYIQSTVTALAESPVSTRERTKEAARVARALESASPAKREVLQSMGESRWSAVVSDASELNRDGDDGVCTAPDGLSWELVTPKRPATSNRRTAKRARASETASAESTGRPLVHSSRPAVHQRARARR